MSFSHRWNSLAVWLGTGAWCACAVAYAYAYDVNDTTPPVISEVAHTSVATSSFVISWKTDEPADGQLEYGASASFGKTTPLISEYATRHEQRLEGLESNVAYYYRVRARDAAGNLGRSDTRSVTTSPVINGAPTVQISGDTEVALPSVAHLRGEVSDDGLPSPPGALILWWSKMLGPTDVKFGSQSENDTTAEFTQPGTYILRLTANDGILAGEGEITVVVKGAARPVVSPASELAPAASSASSSSPVALAPPLKVVFPAASARPREAQEAPSSERSADKQNKAAQGMRRGASGERVKAFQRALIRGGYLEVGGNTGIFDDATEQAVKRLQCDRLLICSGGEEMGYGVAGPRTLREISRMSSAPEAAVSPSLSNAGSAGGEVFTEDLRVGMRHPEARLLQKFLNALGFAVSTRGTGSPGFETDYYGRATADAVLRFRRAIGDKKSENAGAFTAAVREKINAFLRAAGDIMRGR